jgi:hypothetical protein
MMHVCMRRATYQHGVAPVGGWHRLAVAALGFGREPLPGLLAAAAPHISCGHLHASGLGTEAITILEALVSTRLIRATDM